MRLLRAALLGVVVAGCATAPPVLEPADSVVVRPVLTQFHVRGRLAARNGDEAVSGRFSWQHAPGFDRWDFFSPLGQRVARLNNENGSATLLLADGKAFSDALDPLLARMLGMSVPVEALPRWVQGGSVARETVRETDTLGRPVRLADRGWTIRYPAYADETPGALPRSIDASRGDARLRLIIDEWL